MCLVNRKYTWPSLGIALVLFVAAAPGGKGLTDGWKVIGPGGGGAMYHPTISPHTTKDVFVNCDMTGSYLSHDGGESWRMFNLRGVTRQFVFDPVNPNVMYVLNAALWKSEDRGVTWRMIRPAPGAPIEKSNDHGDVSYPGTARPVALAVDPASSKSLFAVFDERGAARLEISSDGGETWIKSADLPAGSRKILIDKGSPASDRTIYVLASNIVTVRRGGSWTAGPAPEGVDQFLDVSAGFSRDRQLVVYGISSKSIHVSLDGGKSWRTAEFGAAAVFQAVATSENRPDAAYVSFSRMAGQFFGVAKTTDQGAKWQTVWKETSKDAAANLKDNWITERFGPDWGENPLNLGVAPDNPDICYATDLGRTMKTLDGGKTWSGVYSKRVPQGDWTSTGLDVTTAYGIHFDPFDRKRMFISYTDIGMFRSEDGGASWQSSSQGVPPRWVNTQYWMEFDPEVRGRAWAVASGTHDLPRPKMFRRTPVSRFSGGVLASSDGGRTWSVSSKGMPQTAATHIVLDPRSPASSRVLYVSAFGRGVYKSTDGGQSWTLKNEGIEGSEPFAWRLTLDSRGTLYLVVVRRSEDGSIGNAQDGALYRSTDGAEHWTKLPLPEGVNGPNGLTVDVKDPNRLYLAAWQRARLADGGGGIYLSTDGARTWRRVLDKDQHVYDVTTDSRNPHRLFASGFSSAAWVSEDRGENWRQIPGYDFKWGHRVVPDPQSPGHVYITTFGGSVWHGPLPGAGQSVRR